LSKAAKRGPFPKLIATSDIHSPRYLQLFKESLQRLRNERWCLFILAGDLIDKGRVEMLSPVLKLIDDKFRDITLVAVFGNEEYNEVREKLRKSFSRILWLDDEYKVFDCGEASLAIVGTQGSLDRLTSWQRKHKPFLKNVYDERVRKVRELIIEAKKEADYVVLVSHYALSKKNLVGEDPRFWPEMYSSKMERVIAETKPDVAIHGHAHNGSRFSMVAGVPVYNVALPLNRAIVEVKPRLGLEAFF
jgi:Icc-related predicted phosphoesterase